MKRNYLLLYFLLWPTSFLIAQSPVKGIIQDEKGELLSYINVFLKETLEGSATDEEGLFYFNTSFSGEATLCAMLLGYDTFEKKIHLPCVDTIHIIMHQSGFAIKEVTVMASSFNLQGSSQWKKMDAVDLVTVGGSVGDLYKSINTLPGIQMNGESGKLLIRGGESREAQTYIDDMHVLSPYTTTGENEPVRGRYSPFMFEGMNFSLGGYDPEYAQGLSSVLPLTTKDESSVSKYGVNAASVGVGGGGTHAFTDGSLSIDLDYQNLGPYHSLLNDSRNWNIPYQKFSAGSQFRHELGQNSLIKLYAGYDRTWFNQQVQDQQMDLKENNYYINSTYRKKSASGYDFFAGTAFSYRNQWVSDAILPGDRAGNKEWEIHLKTKLSKRYSNLFKLQAGVESMIRFEDRRYDSDISFYDKIDHSIHALYATGSFFLTQQLNLALSSRLEYTTINKDLYYTPRVAINYNIRDYHLSAIIGKYTQLTDPEYLFRNSGLSSENCIHYILGGYHQSHQKIYRIEGYYKKYNRLALYEGEVVTSSGNGYSKGIDIYFSDMEVVRNLEYRIAYSLNFSERKYRDYPSYAVPQYASRHNTSLSLRWTIPAVKNSILGITNRYASGRPYHDPNKEGFMNAKTPHYNSLDLSFTYLASKKVIVYASASNLLARRNIYNYDYSVTPDAQGIYQATAVRNPSSQFFFVGVFITLGGNNSL